MQGLPPRFSGLMVIRSFQLILVRVAREMRKIKAGPSGRQKAASLYITEHQLGLVSSKWINRGLEREVEGTHREWWSEHGGAVHRDRIRDHLRKV